MFFKNARIQMLITLNELYDCPQAIGEAILIAAESAENHLTSNHQYWNTKTTRATLFAATTARLAIHGALFTVWLPLHLAHKALSKIVLPELGREL